ncbi:MAG: malate dehydrogenase [Chloroflexi bacterium]|nr:malate dehydrogenase [Chloroflexota bacterium]
MARKKIAVIGAGMVGATTAQRLAERNYADVVLTDIVDGMPAGKALDLEEAGPVVGYDSHVIGVTTSEAGAYSALEGADIVLVTSGVPRKPGMSRDDLLGINAKIIKGVCEAIKQHAPNCILLLMTNPLDAMCHVALQATGFPRERLIGQAGVLDSARFRTFIAHELKVSVENVSAMTLGGHGDEMVPLTRYATVAGVPISDLIPKDRIDAIVQRTRQGGGEIVNLLKTGSAFYAPAASFAQMVDAIVYDKQQVLPCSVLLKGEYGINDLFVGVPIKLGANGMESVFEVKLSSEEQAALNKSSAAVKELVDLLPQVMQ